MPPRAEQREPEPQRLLLTKVVRPQIRQDLVSRPRLRVQLDQGVERKLTLISTGPGYGKSTLAASWLESASMPGAWLSLDDGDNDPHTHFSYLAAALRTLDPELGAELRRQLTNTNVPPVRSLVTTLINELAVVTRPFVLVLDDLHLIRSPEMLEGFGLLVQNLPHMMRLLVTTRTDPPLPLLRMRARGELLEVRAAELSFTLDETRALLQGQYALSLSEGELNEIQDWSEGWPVGLMLIGQRLQGQDQPERRGLLQRMRDDTRFVQDYLWQETIEQQAPERRRFLIQSSVLDRFNASLCAAVTGVPDAGATLRQLEQDNLFLIGFEGAGHWFRYHHLFTDALRARLAQEYPPETIRELHRAAANWHLAYGTREEAARHALAAGDWDVALPLLEQICAELIAQERVAGLRNWLEPVPRQVLQRRPRLCTWLAWALMRHGAVSDALHLLETAQRDWTPDDRNAVLGLILQIRIIEAIYQQRGDEGLVLVQQALDVPGELESVERARLVFARALLYGMQGDVERSDASLSEVRALAPLHGSQSLQQMERNATAGTLIMRGRLRDAAEVLYHIIATANEWNDIIVPYAHWQLGTVLLEWNDLDEAERILTNGLEITVKITAPLHRTRFHQFLAELAWARADPEQAYTHLEQAVVTANTIGSEMEVRLARARRARFWLSSGVPERTRQWAHESGLDPAVEPIYARLSEYLVVLRLLVHDGRAERALEAAEQAQRNAMRSNRTQDVLELLLLRATAEQALGRTVAAERSLGHALNIGAPERFTRSFIDHGAMLGPVLERAARSDDTHAGYARSLLKAMGLAADERSAAAELLSPRETEVLLLIAAGESNRDIGDHLFISEQTVKKHVSNIFEKLSVSSRTQAIDRGRKLGIL